MSERDWVLKNGQKKNSLKIAGGCHCPHPTGVTIEKEGESKKKMISVGHRGIKHPFDQQELYWVVVKGLGEKPMMLLTHVNVKSLGGCVFWRSI